MAVLARVADTAGGDAESESESRVAVARGSRRRLLTGASKSVSWCCDHFLVFPNRPCGEGLREGVVVCEEFWTA